MKLTTTRVPMRLCPFCGHQLDAATATPDNPEAIPEPGDISVCLRCANALIFDANVQPRRPTIAELVDILQQPELARTLRYAQEAKQRRQGWSER